jgi:hypothetical protein
MIGPGGARCCHMCWRRWLVGDVGKMKLVMLAILMVGEFPLGMRLRNTKTNRPQEKITVTEQKQIRLARLSGVVRSGNSDLLAGTQVQIFHQAPLSKSLCPEGREAGSTYADDKGAFQFSLPAGRYCVVFSMNGFNQLCYANILISPRSHNRRSLDIRMPLAT